MLSEKRSQKFWLLKQIQLLTITKKIYTKNTLPKTTQKIIPKIAQKIGRLIKKIAGPAQDLNSPKETINTTFHTNLPTLINQNKPQPNQPTKKSRFKTPKPLFKK